MWVCFSSNRKAVTLWVLLNIADMAVTVTVVGAKAMELFPVARLLLDWAPSGFIFFKLAAPLAVPPLLYRLGYFHLLGVLNSFLGAVVIWDVFILVAVLLSV